jgi:hypothetical protein
LFFVCLLMLFDIQYQIPTEGNLWHLSVLPALPLL